MYQLFYILEEADYEMLMLLGLFFLAVWFNRMRELAQRRIEMERDNKARKEAYLKLLHQGKTEEAQEEFHTTGKKYTSHPDFCKCIMCSVKRVLN